MQAMASLAQRPHEQINPNVFSDGHSEYMVGIAGR
jgi:hypothetical protein